MKETIDNLQDMQEIQYLVATFQKVDEVVNNNNFGELLKLEMIAIFKFHCYRAAHALLLTLFSIWAPDYT